MSVIPAYATDASSLAVFDLRAYLEQAGAHAREPHRHRFWQLIVFRAGSGEHEVDMASHAFEAGTCVLLADGAVHRFTHEEADGLLVHFAAEHFVRSPRDTQLLLQLRVLATQHPVVHTCAPAFGSTLQTLEDEYRREPRDLEVERSLLDVLLRMVLRALPEAQRETVVLHFLERVEGRYAEQDSIGEYASALGISERVLYDATRRALGRSPGEVLADRVMLEAKRLLAHSDERVAQIAYAIGYSDPGYFSRLFKKHVGVTPSAYRDAL